MISDIGARLRVASHIGQAIDDLVREHLSGKHEEPDVTSRIAQRLEERLRRKRLAGHVIKAITQTIPSHGKGSAEKPTGADLYIAITVDAPDGSSVTKGILIQAKRRDQLKNGSDWRELAKQCRRMGHLSKKGSFAWIYHEAGVTALSAPSVSKLTGEGRSNVAPRSVTEMLVEILECKAGDKRRVPRGAFGDRYALGELVDDLRARNAIWMEIEERRKPDPTKLEN